MRCFHNLRLRCPRAINSRPSGGSCTFEAFFLLAMASESNQRVEQTLNEDRIQSQYLRAISHNGDFGTASSREDNQPDKLCASYCYYRLSQYIVHSRLLCPLLSTSNLPFTKVALLLQ